MSNTPLGPVTSFPMVDTFTIAGIPMPGKWTLTDAKKKYGWQIQMGYGLDGAFVLPSGNPLIVAKFKGEFWDAGDFAIYKQVRKRFFTRASVVVGGALSFALGVDHPELKALGVDAVVLLEMSAGVDAGAGLWTVSLDLLQYRPPLKVDPKPARKTPDAPPTVPTAAGLQQLEQQKLRAEAQAQMNLLRAKGGG